MPDSKPKLVMVNGIGVVQFPGTMEDSKIAAAIKAHKETKMQATVPPSPPIAVVEHESNNAFIPPELERIQNALGVIYKLGKPRDNGEAIASVGEHEPHVIEINDKARWNQGPLQSRGHEIIHLLFSHLPAKIQEQIPKDDPSHPYEISKADEWRAQGKKLWNLPQEAAATLIQTWIADPNQRKRLQPWMSDLTSVPLSIMNPTSPSDKGINTTVRPPIPPIEAYLTPKKMRERAAKLK